MQAELGKGSYARVFRVQRKQDGRVYALKRVRIARMSRKELADTLSEVRFLASIKHPSLIRYYDSFYDDRTTELCIVMEYADAGDLAGRLARCESTRTRLDEAVVWSLFLQLMEGLAYLHRKRVLHRDVKSANCFLTSEGRLKLGDLNVSRLLKGGFVRTQVRCACINQGSLSIPTRPQIDQPLPTIISAADWDALLYVARDFFAQAVQRQERRVERGLRVV